MQQLGSETMSLNISEHGTISATRTISSIGVRAKMCREVTSGGGLLRRFLAGLAISIKKVGKIFSEERTKACKEQDMRLVIMREGSQDLEEL